MGTAEIPRLLSPSERPVYASYCVHVPLVSQYSCIVRS